MISCIVWHNWRLQSRRWLLLGPMDTSQNPKTMEIIGFRVFQKWSRKVSRPKWSRIVLRSFRAIRFLKFTIELPPQAPKPEFSLILLIFYRKWIFFDHGYLCMDLGVCALALSWLARDPLRFRVTWGPRQVTGCMWLLCVASCWRKPETNAFFDICGDSVGAQLSALLTFVA